jgi:hypothetical protein
MDRYKYLKNSDGSMSSMPKIVLKNKTTDIFRVYNFDRTRLDRISAEVYGEDEYGWLILLANPEYAIEFDIPQGAVLRVPYPLRDTLSEFESKIIKQRNIG